MDDRTFKVVVGGGAGALVVAMVALRFCGDLSVPAKPPPPTFTVAAADDILIASSATPAAWWAFVEKDAGTAALPVPDRSTMTAAFSHKLDDSRRTLKPGDAPIDVAGLRLSLEVGGDPDTLFLSIENRSDVDLAYQVATRPSISAAACHSRELALYDANVVAARRRERRSECINRDGIELDILRVETVELPPLAAWYVSRLPATALTSDTRLTRSHRPLGQAPVCNVMMSQAIRSGLESGEIEWRDLVDFYARHRCDTYQFPVGYKAFRRNGERELPAVSATR